jgi:hypothetical protein
MSFEVDMSVTAQLQFRYIARRPTVSKKTFHFIEDGSFA